MYYLFRFYGLGFRILISRSEEGSQIGGGNECGEYDVSPHEIHKSFGEEEKNYQVKRQEDGEDEGVAAFFGEEIGV